LFFFFFDNACLQAQRVHLLGHSAGAHLCSLLALSLLDTSPLLGALASCIGLSGQAKKNPEKTEKTKNIKKTKK
jgi:hypothetical protein